MVHRAFSPTRMSIYSSQADSKSSINEQGTVCSSEDIITEFTSLAPHGTEFGAVSISQECKESLEKNSTDSTGKFNTQMGAVLCLVCK